MRGKPRRLRRGGCHGISGFDFTFGPWDVDDEEMVREPAEEVTDRLAEDHRQVRPRTRVYTTNDGVEMNIWGDIEGAHPEERWIPDIAAEFYDDAVGWVEDYMDAEAPAEALREIAIALDDAPITEVERDTGPLHAEMKFWPPKSRPGFERPSEPSQISVDTEGFHSLRYRVGPYQEDEPHYPPVGDGADDAIDVIQGQYPEMDVSWRLHPAGVGTVEVAFTVASDDDNPDTLDLVADEVAELYSDVALAVDMHMPSAIPKGASQAELEDFARQIDAAIDQRLG